MCGTSASMALRNAIMHRSVTRRTDSGDSSAGELRANLQLPLIKIRLREDTVYIKPAAPRSIGGVLDDAIKLYRDAFSTSWPLALIGQVLLAAPLLVVRLQLAAVPGLGANPMAAARNPAAAAALLAIYRSPTIWLSYLAALIITFGLYNALVVQIDGFATAKPRSIGESIAAGVRLLPCSLLLYLVMFVGLMLGVLCVGLVAGILGAMHVSIVVQGVLAVAFAAVLIYVSGRVFLAYIALIVERAAVFRSFGISWSLIKHHWWRTATVYTVAIVMVLVLYLLVAALDALFFSMLRSSGGMTTLVSQLFSIAVGSVLVPFFPAVLLAIYYDLKLRRDGADLADRVNALNPQ